MVDPNITLFQLLMAVYELKSRLLETAYEVQDTHTDISWSLFISFFCIFSRR
jgi:hypothetical protein